MSMPLRDSFAFFVFASVCLILSQPASAQVEGKEFSGPLFGSGATRILCIQFFSTGNATAQLSGSSNVFRGDYAEIPIVPGIVSLWFADFSGEASANGVNLFRSFSIVRFRATGQPPLSGLVVEGNCF